MISQTSWNLLVNNTRAPPQKAARRYINRAYGQQATRLCTCNMEKKLLMGAGRGYAVCMAAQSVTF